MATNSVVGLNLRAEYIDDDHYGMVSLHNASGNKAFAFGFGEVGSHVDARFFDISEIRIIGGGFRVQEDFFIDVWSSEINDDGSIQWIEKIGQVAINQEITISNFKDSSDENWQTEDKKALANMHPSAISFINNDTDRLLGYIDTENGEFNWDAEFNLSQVAVSSLYSYTDERYYEKIYIDDNLYTKDYIDTNFYDKQTIDENIYTKNQIDENFYQVPSYNERELYYYDGSTYQKLSYTLVDEYYDIENIEDTYWLTDDDKFYHVENEIPTIIHPSKLISKNDLCPVEIGSVIFNLQDLHHYTLQDGQWQVDDVNQYINVIDHKINITDPIDNEIYYIESTEYFYIFNDGKLVRIHRPDFVFSDIPSLPFQGDYFEITGGKFMMYNGTDWFEIERPEIKQIHQDDINGYKKNVVFINRSK